jgi:hypothetical protein
VGPGKDFRKPTCDTLKWLTISLETILTSFSQSRKTSQTMQAPRQTDVYIFHTGLLMLCKKALITPNFMFCKSKSLLSLKIETGYQSPAASKFKVFKN